MYIGWKSSVLTTMSQGKQDTSITKNFHRMWEQKQLVNLYFLQFSGGFEDVYETENREIGRCYIRWCTILVWKFIFYGLHEWNLFVFCSLFNLIDFRIFCECQSFLVFFRAVPELLLPDVIFNLHSHTWIIIFYKNLCPQMSKILLNLLTS